MKNRKIIRSFILIIICLTIFVSLTIKYTEEKDTKKILKYLQNKYSENFSHIEYLSTRKNEETISCDGSVFLRYKVKDSYKHYYKAYSELNDIEFYVYIDKTKEEDNYNEFMDDTYLGYLTRRNVAEKVLAEVSRIFADLIEQSYVIESRHTNPNLKSINIKEELSRVSKQEEEYVDTLYYTKENAVDGTELFFKVNLNFNELIYNRRSDLLNLNQLIKNTENDFNAISFMRSKYIEIHIETSDGYKIVIDEYKRIEYYEPQKHDSKRIDL